MRDYDVVHATLRGAQAGQQIGQVELVAALLPYLSLVDDCGRSRLANKRCLHWIDNSSAVASRMKRYSA